MEIVSKSEFNTWEYERQVQYIETIIGKGCIFERDEDDERKLLFYGKTKIIERESEEGIRRSVRIYPYVPLLDKTITGALLEGMDGISYLGAGSVRKSVRLDDAAVYIFELHMQHIQEHDRQWPICCTFFDDFGLLEALNKQIDQTRAQITEAEAKQQELEAKLKNLDTEYEQKKAEAQADYEKTAASLEQKIRAVQRIAGKYGLPLEELLPDDTENAAMEAAASMGAKELTDYVWSYLWRKKALQYDRSVVARFLDSLHTEQLTILWGEPGSGKTSLPQAVAEAIGAECRSVAVQPSWSDNHDLLGYYNALEDRYISTPFLESLVEANQHPDKLYLVVLDEMNLAHVEYYFSEVLSAMTRDDRALTLYGQSRNANLLRLVELDEQGINAENCKEAKDICMKQLYPGKFRIPDNVRFIGTINMDETTKSLSPKVVDRSYPIRVGVLHRQEKDELQAEVDALSLKENCIVSVDSFCPKHMEILNGGAAENETRLQIIDKLEEIQRDVELFRKVGIVSNRFFRYINQILLWNQKPDIDWLIYDKILSEVRIDESNLEEAKQTAEALLQYDYPYTQKKLDEMIADVDGEQAIGESYYWR